MRHKPTLDAILAVKSARSTNLANEPSEIEKLIEDLARSYSTSEEYPNSVWLKQGYKAGYLAAHKVMSEKLEEAVKHLGNMLEGQERYCHYDHNRNCQEHSWFGLDGDDCPVSEAFTFLEKINAASAT